ncbi:hypothetical protein Pan216_15390 [Planctomycetes bacterium Pan216]|uniref:Esterase PHB depolymerase n=1 Tax=Kolteria novifilia TaxID=2527975 RepID=A0A518B140_9BACT|nr:hypothetical protein Pan216_15390 [Planctomycetes bacterium Pan216]
MPMLLLRGSLMTLFALVATPVLAGSDGTYHQVSYPPSTEPGECQIGVTHTLWIPPGVKTIRGVIVHQHGCGEGACKGGETAAHDLHWQELARKWDCALLGPSYQQKKDQNCRLWCDPRNGSGEVFVQALGDLATKSGHPEIAEVPWCLWGHSGGGFWSSLMQMKHPERIVAIWFQSGTAHGTWSKGEIEAPEIPDAAMTIPMMANPGLLERDHKRFRGAWKGNLGMFEDYRSRGAPIAFTPDPKSGHETRESRYLAIPFFDVCLEERLPEKPGAAGPLRKMDLARAWLADVPLEPEKTQPTPVPAADYRGDASKAVWLPNERIAKAWSEFIKTGVVDDKTAPPAPTDVNASREKEGMVVTWDARADIESGIGGFRVYRDDELIGELPTKPSTRYGRPLFQGMSYHDTPNSPLAKMRYVDPEGSPSNTYRVEAVNSVGLRSK